jgi:hypothetical protein
MMRIQYFAALCSACLIVSVLCFQSQAATQAEIDQVQEYVDQAIQKNRGLIETALREGPAGNWGEAARTFLRAVKRSSDNFFGIQLPTEIDQGAKERDLLILQNFPLAVRYAASKVGIPVRFPDASPAAVSAAHQYVETAFQNNRAMLESAVRAAQNRAWEDAAYNLCTAAPREAECLIVFPEMIRYAAAKFGRTVAIQDSGITSSSSGRADPSLSESSPPTPGSRVCVRDEVSKRISCGQVVQ